ncbi:polysaccharide biosynthesis tyrosine autokinase [Streptomyces sp. URMC 125]|uniref:polysaccharide biosynthesis tyrosine autokinase n=1 Tax=Streptomyces sp. URMC 125 TaxID=3423419 RepID=UPI003F1E20FF
MSAFDPSAREPDQLRDQLRRLFRHRAVIASGVLLGALGGGAVSALGSDSYTATGEVVVRPISTAPFEGGGVAADKQLSMGTERQVALSESVADRAAERLSGGTGADDLQEGLRVGNPPETHILEFEYTAGTPKEAERRVRALLQAYLDHREETVNRRIDTTVTKLRGELEPLLDQRRELDERTAGTTGAAAESERDGLNARIADVQGRITGLKALDTTPGDVVREGDAPGVPSGPGPAVLVAVGSVVGLAGGLVAAWIRSLLDPRARTPEEVRDALRAPVLGTLPRPDGGTELPEVGPSREDERAETYRTIALRLLRHPRLAEPGALLVVAVREYPQTAATAVNLAAALAETGRDVLLVEADPRSPELAGRLPLRGGTHRSPGVDWLGSPRLAVDTGTAGRLVLLPGRRTPDAARAMNSPKLSRLLTGAADRGEYTVATTAPLLSHADGTAVAALVRGVVVVCDPGGTRRDDLVRARELVESVGGHVLGAVLHESGRRRGRAARTAGSGTGTGIGTGTGPADVPAADPEEAPAYSAEDTVALKRVDPSASGDRSDSAYGSYGRYRRAGDGTTLRS